MVKTSIDPTLFHRAAELLAGLPRDRGLRQYGCCYAIWRARKKQDPSLCADTDDEDLPTLLVQGTPPARDLRHRLLV